MPKKKDNVSDISKFKKDVETSTDDKPQEGGTPADIDSAAGPSNTRGFQGTAETIQEIEDEQAKIDAINAQAKKDCAPHQATIKEKKKFAKEEFGVGATAINYQISKRKELRRRNAKYDAMTEDDRHECDELTGQFQLFDKKAA